MLLKQIKPGSLSIIYENSPYGTGGALQILSHPLIKPDSARMWRCAGRSLEAGSAVRRA